MNLYGPKRILALAGLWLWALLHGAQAQPNTVVFSDDFETNVGQSPPPQWAMWGAEQYKNPSYYTHDTTGARSGQASFRIQHPAGTAGYIVSAPARAIKTQRGQQYTATFWARADKPGRASFGFTAYASLQPFVDAPTPGNYDLDVTPQWQRFTFSLDEGWDFFADRSRWLLLTFKATNTQGAQTLWIDDVVVTAQPSRRPGRLLDEATLQPIPLPHGLKAGTDLAFTIDPRQRLRRARRDVGGISFHRVAGWTGQPYDKQGTYTLAPQLESAIRELRLPMTRFYAVGDEPFGLEVAIDRIAQLCQRLDVPQDHTVLELETQSAKTALAPTVWAQAARYCLQRGYKFRHWEISNEPYSSLWGEAGAFPTADSYAQHCKAVSAAIRAANPAAQVGVSIAPESQQWGNFVLKQAAGSYDFVVPHYYGHFNVYQHSFEDAALTENFNILERVLKTQALVDAYNPGRRIYQYDTEWGLHSPGPNGEHADNADRNANVWGTLYRAVRLIYYEREGLVDGASSWQMLSNLDGQGFGILSQQAPDQRFMLYWLYYYFNRHVGDWVLTTDGTAPYSTPPQAKSPAGPLTPTLTTLSADDKTIYVVVANASWERAIPCRISLRHFHAAHTTGVALSNSATDGKPLLTSKAEAVTDLPVKLNEVELTCNLPAHSVVFLTLDGGGD